MTNNSVLSVRDAATHYRKFGAKMDNSAFWLGEARALDAVADEVESLRGEVQAKAKEVEMYKGMYYERCRNGLGDQRKVRLLTAEVEKLKAETGK